MSIRDDLAEVIFQAWYDAGEVGPAIADAVLDWLGQLEPRIDEAHLTHQAAWSEATFGPGRRTAGVCDHIRKELAEIEADPDDLAEWVDVIILAFDGAWRTGATPAEILAGIKAKQAKNEAREWPDWRTAAPDKAIEHVRDPAPPSEKEQTERLRLRQEARFVEGDRVVTTVDTSGPAGVVKAGTVGTVSEPVAVHVVFDGDDLAFLFGDAYRPLSALKKEEGDR